MQIQFNKPVTLGESTYGKGQHQVPDSEVKNNWFFEALVKEGAAIILRADDMEVEEGQEPLEQDGDAPVVKPKGRPKMSAK